MSSKTMRAVARLVKKGLILADGSSPKASTEITTSQLRDYVRAMHMWNPDIVEQSDHEGRDRKDLLEFVRRYSASAQLNNRVRDADPEASLQHLEAHLLGLPPPTKPSLPAAAPPPPSPEYDSAKMAMLDHVRYERHRALGELRVVRKQKDSVREKISKAVTIDTRRKKVERDVQEAEMRVADLTRLLLDDTASCDDAPARLQECEAMVRALQREHADVCVAEASGCPGADMLFELLDEVYSLEEEQAALTDRVSKANADLMVTMSLSSRMPPPA